MKDDKSIHNQNQNGSKISPNKSPIQPQINADTINSPDFSVYD